MSHTQYGYVYFNKQGEYAMISEQTTHTGTKWRVTWTNDLNKASVTPKESFLLVKNYSSEVYGSLPAKMIKTVEIFKGDEE